MFPIGDSHCIHCFKGVKPKIGTEHVGPWTMHRVGRDQRIDGMEKIPVNAIPVLCFGEIDVRCHVHAQCEAGRDELEVLSSLAMPYLKFATDLVKIYDRGVCIMSVTPPRRILPAMNWGQYPVRGADEDRARYTNALNELLKSRCESEKGLIFLNVHKHYADAHGMLIRELSDGNVHIRITEGVQREVDAVFKDITHFFTYE